MTPIEELAQKEIDTAKSRALDRIFESDIKRFVAKKRISEQEGRHLLRGCRLYLEELCNGGHTDLIPCYFREVMPDIPQQRYLSNYKYLFETIISRAVAYLREDLGDNPIIRRIGDY